MSWSRVLAVALAVVSGAIVLLDRFLPHTLLERLAGVLVDWAVVLAACALLAGLLHLAQRHGRIVANRRPEMPTHQQERTPTDPGVAGRRGASLALLIALILTLAAGLFHPQNVNGPLAAWLFGHVQAPLQASLFSLLAFYLLSAAYRALRPRGALGWAGILFVAAAALTLVVQLPRQPPDWLHNVYRWLVDVPTLGAVRGVLLGVALGAAITGLRVLMGFSRPYAAAERDPRAGQSTAIPAQWTRALRLDRRTDPEEPSATGRQDDSREDRP